MQFILVPHNFRSENPSSIMRLKRTGKGLGSGGERSHIIHTFPEKLLHKVIQNYVPEHIIPD